MEAMGVRRFRAWLLVVGTVLLAAAGCREDLVAPANGTCPDFCPPEQLDLVDSLLLDNVLSDSAFSGYVQPYDATSLQVYRDSTEGGETASRAVVVFETFSDSLLITSSDTTRGAVLGTDSFVVQLPVRGRNPAYTGLEVALYRIPVDTDSSTTFVDLDPYFTDSTLLAVVPIPDSLTSDTLSVVLDPLAFPALGADGNRAAVGIALRSPSSYVQIGSADGNDDVELTRYVQLDSAGVAVPRRDSKAAAFDSFLASPQLAATSDERDVGGSPASRTMMRFDLPRRIADSSTVVRATLVLVPTRPIMGAPGDSLAVIAQGLAADVGAKSPLQGIPSDSVALRVTFLTVGSADTVRLDVTDLVIGWTQDTTLARAFAVRALPEGGSVAMLRMGASTSGTARPQLHVTFVPPLTLGGR
jgi:hypothetical protein